MQILIFFVIIAASLFSYYFYYKFGKTLPDRDKKEEVTKDEDK